MKKYIAIALATVLAFSSCKDFLVQDPIMTQSTELTLSDYNGLNKAVAGAYAPLVAGAWYGGCGLVLNSEMRVGNAMIPVNTEFTSGRMTTPYKMTYEPSSTEGLWAYGYYVISAVNNVIDKLSGKEGDFTSGSVSREDVNNIEGEAYALRALAHFDLLRTYGYTNGDADKDAYGIPLILKPQNPSDMPARNTVTECYDRILKDLTKADSLMSASYVRSGVTDTKGVITKDVIYAMFSRVYLYNKQYQKAADYATKLIDSDKYSLWTVEKYPLVWGGEVADPDGGEVIFEVYGKQTNDYDEYWEGPSHMTNPLGYADCAATFELVGLFEQGDVRGTTGVRGTDDGKVLFCTDKDQKSGNQMWTMKYFGKGDGNVTSTPDVNNTIVFRLSEMYLIRAEAYVMLGRSGDALKDVNTIRTARGASVLGAAGLDLILKERRLELNFEGHYWFDLARLKKGYSKSDAVIGTIDVPADSKYWAMPIPKGQIDVDKNLVQNPGY